MPNSQTRKRSSKRASKSLNDLQWLANPQEQLKRALSFVNTQISDEEFYRFFEEIGEVPQNRSSTRKSSKAKSPKPKSPRAAKSPKGKIPKSEG